MRRLLPFVLVAAAVALTHAAEAGAKYRNFCAPWVAPDEWDEDEDGPFEAPPDVKPLPKCPVQLSDKTWRERCALHLPPPGWDEEEDGVYVAEASALPTCIILFVPHLLDTGVMGRFDILGELLTAAMTEQKQFAYFWSEVGAQPALEAELRLGTLPQLALYSPKKEAGAVMPQAYTAQNIESFLLRATVRNVGARPVRTKVLESPGEWDYNEAEPPTCDDESYDDIELEGVI